MEHMSFKERVAQIAIEQSRIYKDVFVDYEYLVCSDAFVNRDYYIIAAKEDNYRHLIGVNTAMSAEEFFQKCLNGELVETDFDFVKQGRSEKEVKGSVRRKIRSLPFLTSMMGKSLAVQENFTKNGVICTFATTDCDATVGFVDTGKARPKSLLWGDSLDWEKAGFVDLVVRKKVGDPFFTDVIFGDAAALIKYLPKIEAVLSPSLYLSL